MINLSQKLFQQAFLFLITISLAVVWSFAASSISISGPHIVSSDYPNSRVTRATANKCPEAAGAIETPEGKTHEGKVNEIIAAFETEFKGVKDELSKSEQSYNYICTLGKGSAEAVIFKVTNVKNVEVALKVGWGVDGIAALKKEVEMTREAYSYAPKFVFQIAAAGPSKTAKKYYFMEMPIVGKTLDKLMKEEAANKDKAAWQGYFKSAMEFQTLLHNDKNGPEKCLVHGDLHFGNIAVHTGDLNKIYVLDFGDTQKCAEKKVLKLKKATISATALKMITTEFTSMALSIGLCACGQASLKTSVSDENKCPYGAPLDVYDTSKKSVAEAFVNVFSEASNWITNWETMITVQNDLSRLVAEKLSA